ncbi:hypothetical protein FRC15_009183 [Serendipita sp. 397]|nr:hypothetical protein FRC15_009183 [Serendipita sp. 397]
MPPKRKRPAATTTVPSKRRSQRSNRLVSDEQDADNESELVASDAGPWPPPSSYSGVSKLHFDDISQYSDVAPSFPQLPRRSSRFKYARGPALVILDAVINKSTHLPQPLSAARDALQAVIQIVTVCRDISRLIVLEIIDPVLRRISTWKTRDGQRLLQLSNFIFLRCRTNWSSLLWMKGSISLLCPSTQRSKSHFGLTQGWDRVSIFRLETH